MSYSTDRNLLFGVLALQTNFVDQNTLIKALQSWVEEKERSLAEILQRNGAISHSEHSALELMVQTYLDRHDNDFKQSLASIACPQKTWESLITIDDPNFQQRLESLAPGSDHSTVVRLEAQAHRLTKPERFHILRPLARGGLGEVLVARDEQLQREVALKQIRDRYADDLDSRSRFVLEAEVTGSLEHPGIVPVYTLGATAEGRPYYIMRLIRGESLHEAIDSFHKKTNEMKQPLALHKLLRRFVDACNAVAYAHSRGVLHRDIKPSNIMLGPYGETLVVDWGLAKVIGREALEEPSDEGTLRPSESGASKDTPHASMHTQAGAAVGTPAFMSPEQAMGIHDSLTPASDVYSLGATLYAILTGSAPFPSGDLATVLAQVQRGEFAPPRKTNPWISPALEAVCLKAMARKAKLRYSSAQSLADEVERWLADEPVSAWPEPFLRRASRWVRRHKTVMTGAGAAAAVALAGLLVGVVLLGDANRRERVARKRADQNFQMAKSAVDEYLTKVSNDPRLKQHDLELLRRDLLETAREFYDRFRTQRSEDPALQSDRAQAYGRLAQITADLGDETKAITLLEEARGDFEDLIRRYPEASAYRTGLAIVLQHRGDFDHRVGRFDQAERAFQQAVAVLDWENALAGSITDAQIHKSITAEEIDRLAAAAHVYNGLGALLDDLARYDEAEAAFRREAQIRSRLIAGGVELGPIVEDLAANTINLANFYERTGRYEEAQTALDEAIDLLKRLQRQEGDRYDAALRANLASAYTNRGKIAFQQGQMQPAEDAYRAAIKLLEKLVRAHPLVVGRQTLLAICRHNLGSVLQQTGRFEAAEQSYRKALELCQRLHQSFPEVPYYQKLTAGTFTNLGEFTMELDRDEEALAAYEKALTLARDLADRFPSTPEYEELSAANAANLAGLQLKRGRLREAQAAYEQSLEARRELAKRYPQAPRHRSQLAGTLMNLGVLHYQSERWQKAQLYWGQARGHLQKLTEEHPQVEEHKTRLVEAYNQIAMLATSEGRFEAAEEAFQAAQSLWAKLLSARKDSADFQYGLARTLINLAHLYDFTIRFELAANTYAQAIDRLSLLANRYPKAARYRRAIAGAKEGLGLIHVAQDNVDAAQQVYREMIATRRQLVSEEPNTPQYTIDLSRGLTNMANLLRDHGKSDQALPLYDETLEVLADLTKDGQGYLPARPMRRQAHYGRAGALSILGLHERALADYDAALAENPGGLEPMMRIGRLESLAALGRLRETLDGAKTLAKKELPGFLAYGLASVCAVAFGISQDEKNELQQKPSQEFRDEAMILLERARQTGFFNEPSHMQRLFNDPNLSALRKSERFQKFLKKVHGKGP